MSIENFVTVDPSSQHYHTLIRLASNLGLMETLSEWFGDGAKAAMEENELPDVEKALKDARKAAGPGATNLGLKLAYAKAQGELAAEMTPGHMQVMDVLNTMARELGAPLQGMSQYARKAIREVVDEACPLLAGERSVSLALVFSDRSLEMVSEFFAASVDVATLRVYPLKGDDVKALHEFKHDGARVMVVGLQR